MVFRPPHDDNDINKRRRNKTMNLKEFLEKNKNELLIIFGTIVLWVILLFVPGILSTIASARGKGWALLLSGFFAAIAYIQAKKHFFGALIVGVATSILVFMLLVSVRDFIIFAVPGYFAALISLIVWKNLSKAVVMGIITFLVLFIGLWVFLLLGFLGSVGHI